MDTLNELLNEINPLFSETVCDIKPCKDGLLLETLDKGEFDQEVVLTPEILVKMHRAAKLARNVEDGQ